MRKEVVNYYNAMNIPVEKMVDIGSRHRLTGTSIRQAAEEVYDELYSPLIYGAYVEPIRVAWKVYGKAKHIGVQQRENINKAYIEINERLARIEEMLVPWYTKLWRKFNAS